MLLYYGCCHPSGPAPIPSQKPEFLKPGNTMYGKEPKQYKQSNLQSKRPQYDKQVKLAVNLYSNINFRNKRFT